MTAALKRCWLVLLGATLTALAAFLLFAWSGFYDVAASRMHWRLTRDFLAFGLRRAVTTHSREISAPDLDDMNLIVLGAGHFEGGCAPCHGAPGRPRNPIANRMLPNPPDLAAVAADWTAAQLFWIVKHGLKYTGMPAWSAPDRDDDVWSVVAFLRKLPDMKPERYRSLAIGETRPPPDSLFDFGVTAARDDVPANCERCHGRFRPRSAHVPRLAGQSKSYLERSLRNFAGGLRQSGVMQPIAATLSAESIKTVSLYYSKLSPSRAATPLFAVDSDAVARGRDIATNGVPEANVPACRLCHKATAAPGIPSLDGQFSVYIDEQLKLWRNGLRAGSGDAAVMRTIASRLNEREAKDVASYFQSMTSVTPSLPLAKR